MDKVVSKPQAAKFQKPQNQKKSIKLVLTENDLKAWAKKIDKCNVFAIDTETSSLDTMTADFIGISSGMQ